jgi:hypothetical protein
VAEHAKKKPISKSQPQTDHPIRKKILELSVAAIVGGIITLLAQFAKPFVEHYRARLAATGLYQRPTEEDFTGQWNVQFGQYEGQMNLENHRHNLLFGDYQLHPVGKESTLYKGTITGQRDSSVNMDLMWDSKTVRWHVDAAYRNDAAAWEIKGSAQKFVISGDDWKEVGPALPFLATASK